MLVRDYTAIVKDPQVKENGYIVEFDDPVAGHERVIGNPLRFSETEVRVAQRSPELGEHTEEILQELGLDWTAIESLRDEATI